MSHPPSPYYTDLHSKPIFSSKTHREGYILYFWASWHESSAPGGSTHALFETLAASVVPSSSAIHCGRIEAERYPTLCLEYNVTVVPTFVFVYSDDRPIQKWEGTMSMDMNSTSDHSSSSSVLALTQAAQDLLEWTLVSSSSSSSTPIISTTVNHSSTSTLNGEIQLQQFTATNTTTMTLEDRLKKLIHQSKVMVFMKGLPSAPRCGFSRQICQILDKTRIPYEAFDILQDETVRQGLKDYSKWPTYPQLYVNGELIGGLDIVKELEESGELEAVLAAGV